MDDSPKPLGTLNNGDSGRPCEGKYENGNKCKRTAYQLSSTDKPIGVSLDLVQPTIRIIRYKCSAGHRFDKEFSFNKPLFPTKERQE
jgi:hypothetical protein